MSEENLDDGDLVTRTLAMPADTNPSGDIFGGWILSQMDIGGAIAAAKVASGKIVTVSIDGMKFIRPVAVGDVVCVYAKLVKQGRTSVAFHLKTYVHPLKSSHRELVTKADFTYVNVGPDGKPTPI